MKLIIAGEYSGFLLKEAVRKYLIDKGHQVDDVGQRKPEEKVSYVDSTIRLVKEFQTGKYDRGILICGTGAGVSILANKFKGIYCVACESVYTASRIPMINNANVISFGANVVGPDNACKMVDAFLEQSFCNGFDADRTKWLSTLYDKFLEVEKQNFGK